VKYSTTMAKAMIVRTTRSVLPKFGFIQDGF